jgi:excisionase family DNA binding protein
MAASHPRSDGAVLDGDLDIATAAKAINTSERFIRRRIADGTLKAHRIAGSRLIRIRRADLDALRQDLDQPSGRLTPELRAEIRKAVDAWPPLSPEQRDAIARIFSLPGVVER